MLKDQSWRLVPGDAGILAPGAWSWLRILAWAVLLFVGATGLFFVAVMASGWLHLSGVWPWAFAILVPIFSFLLYAVIVRKAERRVAQEIRMTWRMIPELLVGCVLGFCFLSTMLLLLWSLDLYHVQRSHWSYGWDSLVFNSYISATLEELAFRAILLRLLARVFGPPTGLVLSSALFGFAHITHGSWLGVFGIFLNGGFTLGLLYMATGRLWMSIGMHIGWDFTEDSILGVNNQHGVLLSTPTATSPAFLTGGSFGPDASLLSGIVALVAILAILYCNSRGLFQARQGLLEPASGS